MKKIMFFVMIVIATPILMSCAKVDLFAQRTLADAPNAVKVEGIATSLTTGIIIITDMVTGVITRIPVNSIIRPRYAEYSDGTIRATHGGTPGDVISPYTFCRPASMVGGKPEGTVHNPGNTAGTAKVYFFETTLGANNVPISITFSTTSAKLVGDIDVEQWRTTPWYSGYYFQRSGGYSHGVNQDNQVWRILETTY